MNKILYKKTTLTLGITLFLFINIQGEVIIPPRTSPYRVKSDTIINITKTINNKVINRYTFITNQISYYTLNIINPNPTNQTKSSTINNDFTAEINYLQNADSLVDNGLNDLALKTLNDGLNHNIKHFQYYNELTADFYCKIAYIYCIKSNYSSTIRYLNKALSIRRDFCFKEKDKDYIDFYNTVGYIYLNLKEYYSAIKYFSNIIPVCDTIYKQNSLDKAIYYNNIAYAYCRVGDYSKAQKYINNSHYAKNLNINIDDIRLALIDYTKGLIYLNNDKIDSANICLNNSIAISNNKETSISRNTIANIWTSFGWYYCKEKNERDVAKDYFNKVINLYKNSKDTDNITITNTYLNLVSLYLGYYKDYLNVEKYFDLAENGLKNIPDTSEVKIRYYELKALEFVHFNYDSSMVYLKKMNDIYLSLELTKAPEYAHLNCLFGYIYLKEAKYTEAIKYSLIANKIYNNQTLYLTKEDLSSQIENLRIIGWSYYYQKDYANSNIACKKAIDLINKNDLKEIMKSCNIKLNKLLKKLNKTNKDFSI